jgi:hypothetical protein
MLQRIKKLEKDSASKKPNMIFFNVKDCLTIEERDREQQRLKDEYVARGNELPRIVVFTRDLPRFLDASVKIAN